MKNLLLITLVIFVSMGQLMAQSIVGTDPENKNVVLEEFTGINCPYCPDGHVIAQAIYDAHPEDVVLINIHQGGYASPSGGQPDFRTPWGDAIAGQSGLTGYPMGTVNRHVFSGTTTAMSRGSWTSASNQILGAESYLNVGCKVFIAESTMNINVEVYYTGDSPEPTNFLNIAILQNNIVSYQSGGSSNYVHKHMLRDMLTGQWGVEIEETTEGSLYTYSLVYELPADIYGIPTVMEDMDVVAFVSETTQEIVSGIKGEMIFQAAYDYDASVSEILHPSGEACIGALAPQMEMTNFGGINLTEAVIEYSVNSAEVFSYNWTGDLEYTNSEVVTLPAIPVVLENENDLQITIISTNGVADENTDNNTSSVLFGQAPQTSKNIGMQLFVGYSFGDEISWEFVDGNNEVLVEGSDYSNGDLVQMNLPIVNTDCYILRLFDSSGNGFSGNGYLKLKDNGAVFAYITTELEDQLDITFLAGDPTGISPISMEHEVSIYPNPSYETAHVSFLLEEKANVNISIYNIVGSQVLEIPNRTLNAGEQNIEFNTNSLEEGIYFVNLQINNQTITKKITVLK